MAWFSKSRCTGNNGQHTWSKWVDYSTYYQRRSCTHCGLIQKKDI